MKKVIFVTFFATVFTFAVERNSWAVAITYLSGDIFAFAETTNAVFAANDVNTYSAFGFAASGNVTVNKIVDSLGPFALASGVKLNGTGVDEGLIRFSLNTTTDISNQTPGDDIREMTSTAIARSGVEPNGMIRFKFDVNSVGEAYGDQVQLDVTSTMNGVLKSFNGGVATVDFEFSIFTTTDLNNAVISFNPDTMMNNSSASAPLPGAFGTLTDDTTFKIGDEFFVFFEQKAFASAIYDPNDPVTMSLEELGIPGLEGGQSASAFAVQSTTDLLSVDIGASAMPIAPVPEPSTMILIAIGLAGTAIIKLRNRRKKA